MAGCEPRGGSIAARERAAVAAGVAVGSCDGAVVVAGAAGAAALALPRPGATVGACHLGAALPAVAVACDAAFARPGVAVGACGRLGAGAGAAGALPRALPGGGSAAWARDAAPAAPGAASRLRLRNQRHAQECGTRRDRYAVLHRFNLLRFGGSALDAEEARGLGLPAVVGEETSVGVCFRARNDL